MTEFLKHLSDLSKEHLELAEKDLEFLSVIDEKLATPRSIVTIAAEGGTGKTFIALEWAFKALDYFAPNSKDGTTPLFSSLHFFDLDGNQSALNFRKQVQNIKGNERISYYDKTIIKRETKKRIRELERELREAKDSYDEIDLDEIERKKELLSVLKKWNYQSQKSAFFELIAERNKDLDGALFIIDSLNSIVKDVKNDERCASFYDILDDLKAKGASSLILSHCTKSRDENGEPIIAGSHEIKDGSDFQYLLLKEPKPNGEIIRFNLLEKKARIFRGIEHLKIGLKLDMNKPAGARLEQCEPFGDLENPKGDEYSTIAKAAYEVILKQPEQQLAKATLYSYTYEHLGRKIGRNKVETAIKNELSKADGLLCVTGTRKGAGIRAETLIGINPICSKLLNENKAS